MTKTVRLFLKNLTDRAGGTMDLQDYQAYLNAGKPVVAGLEVHQYMHLVSQEALKLTAVLNNSYHTPEEIRCILKK